MTESGKKKVTQQKNAEDKNSQKQASATGKKNAKATPKGKNVESVDEVLSKKLVKNHQKGQA